MVEFLKRCLFLLLMPLQITGLQAQSEQAERWEVSGPQAIEWNLSTKQGLPHQDNIEMAGKRVAGIVHYAVDTAGRLTLSREVIFPQFHPYIKSTDSKWAMYRAYLRDTLGDDILPRLFIGQRRFVPGPLNKVRIAGLLELEHQPSVSGVALSRKLLPSPGEALFVEQLTYTNQTEKSLVISCGNVIHSREDRGVDGTFTLEVRSDAPAEITLEPGTSFTCSVRIMAKGEEGTFPRQSTGEAAREREAFLGQMAGALILETPDPVLNTLFEFSKIRASESIFDSKLGLIHSPGGGRYYVGIWANDQAEYVSPFFPYLGYAIGNQSAMNTFRAFAGEMNEAYDMLRYAFEVEGTVPPYMLDRGDAAMIAIGASQYALARGDLDEARELWPLITWCLEYCHRQLNGAGVVRSESDEMEGRVATGSANLATSSLYYGALQHASDLARALGASRATQRMYSRRAESLATAIEAYFGAEVEGLNTYKYYAGHAHLRHWICLPLVVGLQERSAGTIQALFERLWTENGVHVEKNSEDPEISRIFWDRGTLYALRGTFLAGATDASLEKLQAFSAKRLLGDRVPYVVEAYPEGEMAHLSAESGLYGRVFVEGLFGIVPTGTRSFRCTPRLPSGWDRMALRRIQAFGQDFDLEIWREGAHTLVKVSHHGSGKVVAERKFSGKPIQVQF